MIRRVLGLTALGGALVGVACSTTVVSDKYPSVDAFCDGKADAECKEVAGVCGVSADACKGKRVAACKATASAAVGRAYAPSKAEACITKTTELYQGSRTIDPVKEAAYTDACEHVFAGAIKRSQPCTVEYECEGDLICDTQKGFCADKVEKKADDPCNNPGEVCPTGLYCQLNGTVRFCRSKKNVDEACDTKDTPCLEALRCVAGKCTPKVANAGACETKDDCVSGACNAKICVAKQYESENSSCADFGGAS
jgi:hypothetical protein